MSEQQTIEKIKTLYQQLKTSKRELGQLLLSEREKHSGKSWKTWVEENLPFKLRQAQKYMKFAREVLDENQPLNKALGYTNMKVPVPVEPATQSTYQWQVEQPPEASSLEKVSEASQSLLELLDEIVELHDDDLLAEDELLEFLPPLLSQVSSNSTHLKKRLESLPVTSA